MKKIFLLLIFGTLAFSLSVSADDEKIRFGVMHHYPPFIWRDSLGKTYGFDASIAETLCQTLHKKCVFVPMDFYSLFAALEDNKIDAVISAVTITQARKEKFDFTLPYYNSPMGFITILQSSNVDPSLKGKRIATLKGSSFHEYVIEKYPHSQVSVFTTPEETIDALSKDKVDLVLLDSATAQWWIQHGAGQFQLVLTLPPTNRDGYAIAVKKGNTTLLNQLNWALKTIINNGKYQQLVKVHLPSAP